MRTVLLCCFALLLSFIALGGCTPEPTPPAQGRRTVEGNGSQRTVQGNGALVTLPEQGWSDADAEWFYNVSQGSQLLPYEWIAALKTADGKQTFAESIPHFGYVARKKSKDNPLGLPVGFVKDTGVKRDWVGLNCSACHTAIIEYGDKSYLIDGAAGLTDLQGLLTALDKALDATINDVDSRFAAFAKAVLGNMDSPTERAALLEELRAIAKKRKEYSDRNVPKPGATQFGFGRVDAIGAILNEVTVRFIGEPKNHRVADAPVSYPFLWDTPYHDKVQWNGSAPNTVFDLGNLARNVGEVLGVFGDIEIPAVAPKVGYRSTVQIGNLREIEQKLKRLKSPLWPAEIPRAKNHEELAAEGEKHFKRLCADCHSFQKGDRDDDDRKIVAKMDDIGTDPKMAENFRTRNVLTNKLNHTRINFNPLGSDFGATASGEAVLVHAVIGTIAGSLKPPPDDELDRLKQRKPIEKANPEANEYKGRPLNGIWATAPYLHNGSVPTLRDLLKPQKDRADVFWVGSRKFNPKDVGFESQKAPNTSEFDTKLPGNWNRGHEYGTGVSKDDGGDGEPKLNEDQIEELLEFLKSL